MLRPVLKSFSTKATSEIPQAIIKKSSWTTGKVLGAMAASSFVTGLAAKTCMEDRLNDKKISDQYALQELQLKKDYELARAKNTYKELFIRCANNSTLRKNIETILNYGEFFLEPEHLNLLIHRVRTKSECFAELAGKVYKTSPRYFEAVSLGAEYEDADKMQDYQLELFIKLKTKGLKTSHALQVKDYEVPLFEAFMFKTRKLPEDAIEMTHHFSENQIEKIMKNKNYLNFVIENTGVNEDKFAKIMQRKAYDHLKYKSLEELREIVNSYEARENLFETLCTTSNNMFERSTPPANILQQALVLKMSENIMPLFASQLVRNNFANEIAMIAAIYLAEKPEQENMSTLKLGR